MTAYRLVADPQADLDIAAAFEWYEKEQAGLGQEFLAELRATYDRVSDAPLQYQHLRSGIRRALLRRFPYAVYFARALQLWCSPCFTRVEIQQSGSDEWANHGLQPARLEGKYRV